MLNKITSVISTLLGMWLSFNGGSLSEIMLCFIFAGITIIIDKLEKMEEVV